MTQEITIERPNYMNLKIPPLIIVLVSALLMRGLSRLGTIPKPIIPGVGAAFLAAALGIGGLAICALGIASFRRARTTVNPFSPGKASALVISGIYRHSRNPMYLGFALMLFAWGVFLSSLFALLVVPAFVMYMNRYQIEPEENALEKLFGQEYLDYKKAVRRWL